VHSRTADTEITMEIDPSDTRDSMLNQEMGRLYESCYGGLSQLWTRTKSSAVQLLGALPPTGCRVHQRVLKDIPSGHHSVLSLMYAELIV